MKKPRKSKSIGNLDSSFEYNGPPPIRSKTITRHSTMAGYGSYDSRNQSPRGKGIKMTAKRNRYD
jgi:hypothetical protein